MELPAGHITIGVRPHRVFGYNGKPMRDNIHSHNLVEAFRQFFQQPRVGKVCNIGAAAIPTVSCSEPSGWAVKSTATD
jgi:CDP-paratose 2-epimerase